MSVLRKPVLVLNKLWVAIAVVSVKKAINLLNKFERNHKGELVPKARIVDISQLGDMPSTYDWEEWAEWSKMLWENNQLKEKALVRSASSGYKVPEIIVLTTHDKLPQQRAKMSRRNIHKRDGFRCQYCGCRPGSNELTIDHVEPKSVGGPTTWDNCVSCCVDCNSKKANRTPAQAGMKLRNIPKKPRYVSPSMNYRVDSWQAILGVAYWEFELENDN